MTVTIDLLDYPVMFLLHGHPLIHVAVDEDFPQALVLFGLESFLSLFDGLLDLISITRQGLSLLLSRDVSTSARHLFHRGVAARTLSHSSDVGSCQAAYSRQENPNKAAPLQS